MTIDLFHWGRLLHSCVGVVALIAFWVAGTAVKGGPLHRRAGTIYLCALLAVMALSVLMAVGRALEGDVGIAFYLTFLVSMVGTASWLMWFAIRYKENEQRLLGRTYRILATWLIVVGLATFSIGVMRAGPLTMFLSLLGVGFGANMWRLALVRTGVRNWWLQHHMNGTTLNFIATHDSFLALGVGSLIPEIRHSVPRMTVALTATAVAIGLRLWLGRRHLRRKMPQAR
jgi:hypothetical protein